MTPVDCGRRDDCCSCSCSGVIVTDGGTVAVVAEVKLLKVTMFWPLM